MQRRIISIIAAALVLSMGLLGCEATAGTSNGNYKHLTNKATDGDGVYTDLGNYIIEIADYKDADYEKARKALDEKYAAISGACTACAKLDSKGNVLIGRNLDNQVSQCPAFLIHSTQGKYETISLRYMNSEAYTYETFKQEGYKDKDFLNSISFCVTDSMNTEGLYMEANVREPYAELVNTGTNPGKTRLCIPMLVAMVTRNCATVKEALDYLENEVDIYSTPYVNETLPTQYGYYIGDATGEFGIIEIAANQIYYTPYQPAQANYYLSPKCSAFELNGAGYGRMDMALDGLSDIDNQSEMLEHMKKCMWCRAVTDIEYSYLDEDGVAQFVDSNNNPSIDFRSDFSNNISIDENGQPIESSDHEALVRSNAHWMMDDKNFDTVKTFVTGLFEKSEWPKKLSDYYAGDEKALRDDGNVFTTGASFAVDCKNKSMIIKFWENEDEIYEITMK